MEEQIFFDADGGFLVEGLHDIPDGAVAVSQEEHTALIEASANGHEIVVQDGKVVAVVPAPPDNWRDGYKLEIRGRLESSVLDLAGNPGPAEIASWPNKIEAARLIVSGASESAIILAPTVAKFGVDMAGAAQIVLLRSRLYELAKVVAETMEATTLAALEAATPETVQALLDGLQEQIDTRTAEFTAIRGAATTGDMSLIEAAEAQLLGG